MEGWWGGDADADADVSAGSDSIPSLFLEREVMRRGLVGREMWEERS